jgi:hypothetical protein
MTTGEPFAIGSQFWFWMVAQRGKGSLVPLPLALSDATWASPGYGKNPQGWVDYVTLDWR